MSTSEQPATPTSAGPSEPVKHLLAFFAVVAAVAGLTLTALYYNHKVTLSAADIIQLELSGQPATDDKTAARTPDATSAAIDALRWDFLLIAGYGAALVIGGLLALWLLHTPGARRWVRFGLFTAVVAVTADCLENLLLLWALDGWKTLLVLNLYDAAAVLSIVKFCAVAPAGATALLGLGLTVIRSFTFQHDDDVLAPTELERPLPLLSTDPEKPVPRPLPLLSTDSEKPVPPAPDGGGRSARWQRGYAVPKCDYPGEPDPPITGICLSGGGVRAASVALGFLQSPSIRSNVLPNAQYLVSVSGGGYTAGAFAQLLTNAEMPPPEAGQGVLARFGRKRGGPERAAPLQATRDEMVRDKLAASAFLVGSPEEDHIRRHSSYIANTPTQMLTALGLLAGHLLMTLTLLFGPAILLGLTAGAYYRWVPITGFSTDAGRLTPAVRGASWWALGITAGLAVLCLLSAQMIASHSGHPGSVRHRMLAGAEGLLGLSAVIATMTIVFPGIVWMSSWLLDTNRGGLRVASPIAGVLLTYVASVASLAWRRRSLLTMRPRGGVGRLAPPRGLVQIMLVITALVVLILGWLLLVGGMATVGFVGRLSPAEWCSILVLLLALVLLGGLTDETTLSLHPFYRERLATAFAVRRVRRGRDQQVVAQPYPPTELTTLSKYGAMAKGTAFPHIIFAASATLGEGRTPPGCDRVSYTFCSDWVGGPEIGYVKTKRLEKLAPKRLTRDLTVQGAVALSGAAIAASVGGQGSAWYEPLFVVSGVRLGAWMPNPAFVIDKYQEPRSLAQPGLPKARRVNYLLRELFGIHSARGALLQVSDGGFYDNLGLLELFRRGCTRIYCVDASGDTPPAATTLSQVLIRAYQELGVEAKLGRDTWSTATAGSAEKLLPADPLAALSQRLATTGVITGTFEYPECAGFKERTGTLVVAKASLWYELPYPLLAYASGATVFPHDSTADQWFDDRQYAAYTELGRCLGTAAAKVMGDAGNFKASDAVRVSDGLPA